MKEIQVTSVLGECFLVSQEDASNPACSVGSEPAAEGVEGPREPWPALFSPEHCHALQLGLVLEHRRKPGSETIQENKHDSRNQGNTSVNKNKNVSIFTFSYQSFLREKCS